MLLLVPILMQIQNPLKNNHRKADCYDKWRESLQKINFPAPKVMNWYRFGTVLG